MAGVPGAVRAGVMKLPSVPSHLLGPSRFLFPPPPSSSPKPCRQHVPPPTHTHASLPHHFCRKSPGPWLSFLPALFLKAHHLPASSTPQGWPSFVRREGRAHIPLDPWQLMTPQSPDSQLVSPRLRLWGSRGLLGHLPCSSALPSSQRRLRPWLLQAPGQTCHLHLATKIHVAPELRSLSTKAVLQALLLEGCHGNARYCHGNARYL